MINLILVIIAKLLYILLEPISFVYVNFIKKKFNWRRLNGYFKEEAIAIDRFGNYQYKSLLNALFITSEGYKFGNINETISSALGKNEYYKTLTKLGKSLVKLLNWIDKDHCEKSIDWTIQ